MQRFFQDHYIFTRWLFPCAVAWICPQLPILPCLHAQQDRSSETSVQKPAGISDSPVTVIHSGAAWKEELWWRWSSFWWGLVLSSARVPGLQLSSTLWLPGITAGYMTPIYVMYCVINLFSSCSQVCSHKTNHVATTSCDVISCNAVEIWKSSSHLFAAVYNHTR